MEQYILENNMQSGVYKIENKINNKIYVGSCKRFTYRRHKHFTELRHNKHHNQHLQRSFDKYGEKSFEFIIIEKVKTSRLLEREQHYIDILNPEYNIQRIAGSNLGIKFTEEHKKKMSISIQKHFANEDPVEKAIRLYKIGQKKKGVKQSKGHIEKRARGNNKPIYQFDLKGKFIRKWKSTIAVKHALGYDTTQICKCIKNVEMSAHGYIWDHNKTLNKDDKRLHIKRIKEVQQLDINTGKVLRIFKRTKDAEAFLDIPDASSNISQVFKGIKKSAYGYKWKRIYQ